MDPLRISMVGLSRWESVFVQTSVDLASGIELPPCRFVEDPQGADVLLVDANHRKYVALDEADESGTPVVVAFTEDPDASNADRDLTRPVGYADLISMLKDIESELHAIANAVGTPVTEEPAPTEPKAQAEHNVSTEPVHAAPEYVETIVQKQRVQSPPEHVETIVRDESRETTRKDTAQRNHKPSRLPSVEDLTPPVVEVHVQSQVKPIQTDPAVTELLIYRNGRAEESLEEKARPARRFVEGTRLLGILNRISRWGIPAEVTHFDFPTLLISPENNAFVASGNALAMPAMFRDSAMSFAIEDLAKDVAEAMLTSDKLAPLSHLIYCAALFGSEGRLMLNSNPQDRLHLIGTPNFDAVPHLQEHKKIARYLMAAESDLADIAEATGVSISIVIDFCNACEAIGLVRRVPDSGFRHSGDESGVQQLLGRVRGLFRDA